MSYKRLQKTQKNTFSFNIGVILLKNKSVGRMMGCCTLSPYKQDEYKFMVVLIILLQ